MTKDMDVKKCYRRMRAFLDRPIAFLLISFVSDTLLTPMNATGPQQNSYRLFKNLTSISSSVRPR
jgi:hypothetical protein